MKFTQCELSEGVRLHLCETDKFTSLTCKIFIQQDLKEKEATGTALLPLLLRRGSRTFPSTLHIARESEELYAAEFGSDILKVGERQILELYFQMVDPKLLPQGEKLLERGLRSFRQIFTEPFGPGDRFHEPYFSQEKRTLEQDLKGLVNDKRSYALARFTALMCEDEPFGIYKYGDLESLEHLDNRFVYEHYQNLLQRHPLDVFIVGSNLDQAADLFASLIPSSGRSVTLQKPMRVQVEGERVFEESLDVNQTVLVMGYRTNCTYLDDDYYALLVGNGVLGGFPHSKLFMNVRERASLAYSVGSSIEGSKGLLTIVAGISDDSREQAVEIINEQVNAIKGGRISPEELEQTKRGLISAMTGINDNPAGIIDRNVIGMVEGELRSVDQVVEAISRVEYDDCVRAMQGIELDTTYLLRPGQKEGANYGED